MTVEAGPDCFPQNDAVGAIGDIRTLAIRILSSSGVPSPDVDVELLLGHVLQVSRGRVQALAMMNSAMQYEHVAQFRQLLSARADRVPLQHLTGLAAFRGFELEVGPGVFVPRPETEGVVQHAIDVLAALKSTEPIAVDLCTGSGAIALALAQEVPAVQVHAIEKSPEAFAWASRNITRLGNDSVQLYLGDVRGSAEILSAQVGRVQVVISNPPYVPEGMIPRDPEVREYDPAMALFSGEDGLDLIREISLVSLELLVAGGTLVLEHAEHQGEAIRNLLSKDGWGQAQTHKDLTGRDRSTVAIRS